MHDAIVETTLHWMDESATESWARHMAAQLQASPDAYDVYVALRGPLGAGKTTLVRHLLRALGVQGRIKSPTYALLEGYEIDTPAGPRLAWHVDLYRFENPLEWEDAGLRELFAAPGLKLVEWPERAQGLLPEPDVDVSIEPQEDNTRRVHLRLRGPRGRQWN